MSSSFFLGPHKALGGRVRLEGLGWSDWCGRVLVKGLGWKDRVEGLERKGWGALSRKVRSIGKWKG